MLTKQTFVTLADEDAGPTKAYLVKNRDKHKELFEDVYGKRPREELYDLNKDPHQMNNVAESKNYKAIKDKLHKQLMDELKRTNDPRLVNDGDFFETPPMARTDKR